MAGNSSDPGRSVTSKVTAILTAFADETVLTLTEIAAIAKLPTSTAHRLASELLAWRLLERTEAGGYRIGLPLRIIGSETANRNRSVLVARAEPVLGALVRTIGTDARLGVLHDDKVFYLIDRGQSRGDSAAAPPPQPAHSTAMGKALLAFSPPEVIDRILAGNNRTTPEVAYSEKTRRALSIIRVTQMATGRDVCQPDRSVIAMPVFGGGGTIAAAIELTVDDGGVDRTAAISALTVACRSLSRQLATGIDNQGSMRGDERQDESTRSA